MAQTLWTKAKGMQRYTHSSGYVVECASRGVWDAYLPAWNDDPEARTALWLSPGWKTRAAAMSSVQMELRRIKNAVRLAMTNTLAEDEI